MDLLSPAVQMRRVGLDQKRGSPESRYADPAHELSSRSATDTVLNLWRHPPWIWLPEETRVKFQETDCRQCKGRGRWRNSLTGQVDLCQWCKVPDSNPKPGPEWRDKKHLQRILDRQAGILNRPLKNRGGIRAAYKILSARFAQEKLRKDQR